MNARKFIHIASGQPAVWMAHPSCLYHASTDGVVAVCNSKLTLTTKNPYDHVLDASTDVMACERCCERVRAVREGVPA
jgi:hypothetical protein